MNDKDKTITAFEVRIASDSEEWNTVEIPVGEAVQILELLKEQRAEIRQLRLALDIAKGTCKGIAFETDENFMGDL